MNRTCGKMSTGGNVTTTFRQTFQVLDKKTLEWFPGHMSKGIRQMQQQLKNVDCIVEVHDARVPLSGHYADFTKTLTGIKPQIFVLNKMDLTDMRYKKNIITELQRRGRENVLFTNFKNRNCTETKKLLPLAKDLIKKSNRFNRAFEETFSMMIIGVPNVGKSSLINCLRNIYLKKGNAAKVGGVAGITRGVSFRIKIAENPTIFLLDTPGILTPRIEDPHTGLKLALAGCLQDHLVGPEVLADYLLFWFNKQGYFEYVEKLGLSEPCDEILRLLIFLAAKLNKTVKLKGPDGQYITKPNLRAAAEYFVSLFRKGELGSYCLDEDLLYLSS